MSLEGRQGQHNRVQTSINNNTGSPDDLINNALILASGANLGYTPEQTLAVVSENSRRQKPAPPLRENDEGFAQAVQAAKTLRGSKGEDLSSIDDRQGLRSIETRGTKGLARFEEDFTEEDTFQGRTDIEEGFRSEGGERYDSNTGGYVEESPQYRPATKDTGYVSLRKRGEDGKLRGHVLPSGRKYTDKDSVRPEERAFSNVTAQADSTQTYESREERKEAEKLVIGTTTDSAPSSTVDPATGKVKGPMAATIAALEQEGSPAALKLRDKILGDIDPRLVRQRERAEVQKMIAADAARVDPEKVQQTLADNQFEAEILRRTRANVRPQSEMDLIEDVTDLGSAKKVSLMNQAGEEPVFGATYDKTREMGDAILEIRRNRRRSGTEPDNYYYVDETGRPITDRASDIELLLRGDPNKADTSQNQNAPQPQSAPSWVVDNQPDYYKSETSFGNYPQTDTALARSTFANKVRELSGVDEANINLDVRTAADLQRVQEAVEMQKAAKGQALFRVDNDGRQVVAAPGDIRGLMHALKMTGPEQSALASAIAQEALATESTDRRSDAKTIFGVNPNETGVDANIAKVPANSTINTADPVTGERKRRNIRAELAQLEGADAQQPFIGAVIDPITGKQETDAGPRARSAFKPGNMGSGDELERNLRRQAISRQKPGQKLDRERMKSNIMKARGVEEREAVDRIVRESRAAAPGEQPKRIAEDDQFTREAARRDREANAAELERLRGSGSSGGGKKPPTAASAAPQPQDDGVKRAGATRADISERLKREILGRALEGQMNRRNRIKQGLLAAAGAGAGIAGINDAAQGDEGLIRY